VYGMPLRCELLTLRYIFLDSRGVPGVTPLVLLSPVNLRSRFKISPQSGYPWQDGTALTLDRPSLTGATPGACFVVCNGASPK
jgi:hypothetical protein